MKSSRNHLYFTFTFLFVFDIFLINTAVWSQVALNPTSIDPVTKHKPQPVQGQPLDGLTQQQLQQFKSGKKAFEKSFDPSEGLGPLFNQTGCMSCHQAVAVGGSQPGTTQSVTRFGRQSGGSFDSLAHVGGSLLQNQTTDFINCREVVPMNPPFSPLDSANVITIRTSPPTFGSGLIESIADSDILANENNPITGGVAHMVKALEDPMGPDRVGRFGWKAQLPTTLSFSGDASAMELGITNDLVLMEQMPNAPAGSVNPLCDDGVVDPDDNPLSGPRFIDEIADFLKYLAPPPQTPKSGMKGERVFNNIGCAFCHVPEFTTSQTAFERALRNKPVKAYSDFLLHDMGSLGDGIAQGSAATTQMRTAPLWDLKNRQVFLHDGRVQVFGGFDQAMDDVILAHDGEAQNSVGNYNQLTQIQKNDLYDFLASLGRREFDHVFSQGNTVDEHDFAVFQTCYHAPQPHSYTADSVCAVSDIDQDMDVDMIDFSVLAMVFNGPVQDCQCDGKLDLRQIITGSSMDADGNASPDECRVVGRLTSGGAGADITVDQNNKFFVFLNVTGFNAGDQVEFFYNFDGQGNGGVYGDIFCLNVDNQYSMGTVIANSSGTASIFSSNVATQLVPMGTERMSFQAGVLNAGTNSLKSNVVTVGVAYQ